MLPADQKNYLVALQAIKILSKTWLPMILVPGVSRVNKLPVPCLLSLLLPPGLLSGRILLQVKSEQDRKG